MRSAKRGHAEQKRQGRGEREPGSTTDEAASFTDGLAFVDALCAMVKFVGISSVFL